MAKVLGIVFAYAEKDTLRELTTKRTVASLPIAGKYRIIDFILSGFVNSDIYDVSIIANHTYESLTNHIGTGKDWDLMRKNAGVRIHTPLAAPGEAYAGMYRGRVDALARNLAAIRRNMSEYVILVGSNIVCCAIDYKKLLEVHIGRGDDITAVYTRSMNGGKTVPMDAQVFNMDEDERIYEIYNNQDEASDQDVAWSTGIYVMKKSLLEALVAEAHANERYSFEKGVIQQHLAQLKIRGSEYKKQLFEISSVSGYMHANMNFLKSAYREKAFEHPIFTKVKDSVPAIYGDKCKVKHSLIADGCIINGEVENCVISRGVKIAEGSVVKNSIIMQDTEIMPNVSLSHVILDKDVIVRENRQIMGHESYPVVVEKGSIV